MCVWGGLVGSLVQSLGTECLRTLDSDHMANYISSSIAKHPSKDRECEQKLRSRAGYRARYCGSCPSSQCLGG